MTASPPLAIVNARLVDPASAYDGPGAVLIADGRIADIVRTTAFSSLPDGALCLDADGNMLCPGLIDLRVKTGEPGFEPRETLKSASLAAAAGGVTSIIVQPDTDPAVDDPAMVDFILGRARDIGLVHVYPAGAATRGLAGERLAEIGLMVEAGCVYITDADRSIVDSRVFRQVLTYAQGFGAIVAHRPADPWLSNGASATEGALAARLGLPSVPALAEKIMLERDIALAELTGAHLLVDQITTADSIDSLQRARDRGVRLSATTSINHLSFNELDIGGYRTFAKMSPPLRSEADRQALIQALACDLIDVVVSAHTPAPAEDKRLPFEDATPGGVGLETLLPALLTLYHDGQLGLLDLISKVTLEPARLLGLAAGRLAVGAPADLVLCDLTSPLHIDAAQLRSKSKNSPFDGRRLQGRVLVTWVDGRRVYGSTEERNWA